MFIGPDPEQNFTVRFRFRFRFPLSNFIAEVQDVEQVVVVEVVQDGDHRVLQLLDLFALHRAADVEHEDQVLRQRLEVVLSEEVDEVAVLKEMPES